MTEKVKVTSTINADTKKVWEYYTNPKHITNWNFADPTWHWPTKSNDLRVGGTYKARMEAKDGSFGFDFEAIYTKIINYKEFSYEFGGRTANIRFDILEDKTELVVEFDPETENPVEMQKKGWQSILDNFKKYAEQN